uniref:Tudor domain-containing protein n=1 Tax=Panagrolaimus sp. JU765 TaxID=591449 RepID=A0AC34R0M4_9BILA
MSTLIKPKSPIMAPRKEPKEDMTLLIENKIHRIRSRRPFYANVTYVVSPSEIWVQIVNHITENLVKELNDPRTEVTSYEVNDYVLAPVNEKYLARARIVEKFRTGAVVRFLDFGYLAFRKNAEFFIMEKKLWYYPWQTIKVALHDVHPAANREWSKNEVGTLKEVFETFPLVYVIPQNTDIWKTDNDSIPARVRMHGVTRDEMEVDGFIRAGDYLGESIAGLFCAAREFCVMDTPIDDGKYQGTYEVDDKSFDLSYDPLKVKIPKDEFE